MKFMGYRRPDGSFGVRNHFLVISSGACSNVVTREISNRFPNSVAITHNFGCTQIGRDREQTVRVLEGFAANPNTAASLVVGLGCETIPAEEIASGIAKAGRPVSSVTIQKEGDETTAITKGVRKAREMVQGIQRQNREESELSTLTIAVECGASDFTSAIAANPAVGATVDRLLDEHGTVIFSETTEIIGAEHLLTPRMKDSRSKVRLKAAVSKVKAEAWRLGVDVRAGQPTPGNIRAGITTLEEKSLAAIVKAGTKPIEGVLDYAERPSRHGLFFMDTPGNDVESVTGMVAGGAVIVLFTTGLGTPVGSAAAPVIKITGNERTHLAMRRHIDIDVSPIVDGTMSVEKEGKKILSEIVRVASGKRTRSEILGHREFSINRIGPTL